MKTADLMALLQRRDFGPGDWGWLTNVPNSTGHAARRSCDALAMNLWPSTGLALHGFELKVSRSDWTRELRQPDKATELQRFCDHWWLVAGDDSVCPEARDLPETWGLLVARSSDTAAPQLVVVRPAPKLIPEPLDRGFVAGLVRKLSNLGAAP